MDNESSLKKYYDNLLLCVCIDENGKNDYSIGDETIGFLRQREKGFGIYRLMVRKIDMGLLISIDSHYKGPSIHCRRAYFEKPEHKDWFEVKIWENEAYFDDEKTKFSGQAFVNIDKLCPDFKMQTERVFYNIDKDDIEIVVTVNKYLYE